MFHWKLAFVPKPHKATIPQASQMRPIAVGQVLYRIWSRIRIVQVQHLFTPLLAPFQSGSQGPGCLDLFISSDQEFPPKISGSCAALDYTKCFDSLALRLWAGFGLWTLMRPPKPAQMPKDNIYSARPKVRMSMIRFTFRDKDHFCRWPKWWFCIYFIAIPAIRDEKKRLGWWSSMITDIMWYHKSLELLFWNHP